MNRRKIRALPIYPYAIAGGVLALVLSYLMSEGFIVSFAWLLLHKLMLGKILKAYIFLSVLRLLKGLLLISGVAFIAYGMLIVIVKKYAGLLVRASEALELIVEKPAQYLRRHYMAPVVVLLAVIVLALYGSSLSFNFLSDDFGHIWEFRSRGLKVFVPQAHPGVYHYCPVGLILCGLPPVISGYNPFWSHLQCLLLHLTNSLLVFYMCYRLTNRRVVSLVASLLFCTFYMNFEVIFWVTVGTHYGSMTLFVLVSFLCFMRYLSGGSRYYYWAFVALYTLAQLTIEIPWAFLPVYLLYEVLYSPLSRHRPGALGWIRAAASSGTKYILPVAISLATMGLRHFSGIPLVSAGLGLFSGSFIAQKLIEALLYMAIPNNLVDLSRIDLGRGELFYSGVALGLLSIIIAFKSSRDMKFFYFWGVFTLCATALFTGAPQIAARQTYLPFAGFSIFFALFLLWVLELFSRLVESDVFSRRDASQSDRKRVYNAVATLVGTVMVLLIVTKGVSFINDRRAEWRRASDIVTNVLRDIKTYYPEVPSESVVYFVNVPDILRSKPYGPARVFRNGLIQALRLDYGAWFGKAIRLRHTKSVRHVVLGPSEMISDEELDRLSSRPGVEVLFFSIETGSIRKWVPDETGKGTDAASRSN